MYTNTLYSRLRTLVTYTICMIVGGGSCALADTIYSYAGDYYSYEMCSGTYVATCTSDHLTGYFVTSLSFTQLENLTSYSIPVADIVSFNFSDGTNLIVSQGDAAVAILAITTDSSGDITWWDILLQGPNLYPFVGSLSCMHGTCAGYVVGGGDNSGSSPVNSGGTIFEPFPIGVWTAPQLTSIPEASNGVLACIGLAALVGLSVIRRHLYFSKCRKAAG